MGKSGRIVQLVERLVYTEEVTGSSPVPPTTNKKYPRLYSCGIFCFKGGNVVSPYDART